MVVFALMMTASCKEPTSHGRLEIQVDYEVNGQSLVTNTLDYVNEAGNHFLVTEIQWFLSNFEFQDAKGTWIALDQIAYIDTNIPESQTIQLADIPVGTYQKIRFTFGLDEIDNQTGRFPNPPESNMFWPEPLGGGYHYMKLNGKYQNENEELAPMNIHLGIGQNEDFTQFYQNYFTVELPIELNVKADAKSRLDLTMVIDNWFRNPHTYDILHFGSAIMQNQEAQQLLKENGHDVFRVSPETSSLEEAAQAIVGFFQKASPKPHFYSIKKS